MANDDWMIDNTGGEFTPKNEEEGVGSKIVGALGRTAEAIPDALAKTNPLIGMPLQAAFNTEEYQARQARLQHAKEQLAEWRAGAENREKARNLQSQQLAAEQEMLPPNIANKKQALANQAVNLAAQGEQANQAFYNTGIAGMDKRVREMLKAAPEYKNLGYDDQVALFQTPQYRAFLDTMFFADNVEKAFVKGDKTSQKFFEDWGKKYGFRIENRNGVPYLRKEGADWAVPANPDVVKGVFQKAQEEFRHEMQTRNMFSPAAMRGDPSKESMGRYVKALAPYAGGSYYNALKQLRSYYEAGFQNDPRGMSVHFVNQALSDFNANKPGAMQELFSCIAPRNGAPSGELEKLGITIDEGVDPYANDAQKVDPRTLHFKLADGTTLDFNGLCEYMKKNDTFGPRMEEMIGKKQWEAAMKANPKAAMALELEKQKAALKKAAKKKGGEEGEAPQTETTAQDKERAISLYGAKEYIKLTPEKKALLIQRQNEIGEQAIAKGALIRDPKTGEYVPNPKITPELLTEMQELENALLGDVNSDFKGKGFWSRHNGIRKADQQIEQGKKMVKTGADLTRRAVAPPKSGFWERFGDTMGAKDRLALAGTGLSLLGRAKQESGKKNKKSDKEALRRKK